MLIAHIHPANSSADAAADCDESLHRSALIFVTIATARHFKTGESRVSLPCTIVLTRSTSSIRPLKKPNAAVIINTVTLMPTRSESSGLDFRISSARAAAARAAAEVLITSSIAKDQTGL